MWFVLFGFIFHTNPDAKVGLGGLAPKLYSFLLHTCSGNTNPIQCARLTNVYCTHKLHVSASLHTMLNHREMAPHVQYVPPKELLKFPSICKACSAYSNVLLQTKILNLMGTPEKIQTPRCAYHTCTTIHHTQVLQVGVLHSCTV